MVGMLHTCPVPGTPGTPGTSGIAGTSGSPRALRVSLLTAAVLATCGWTMVADAATALTGTSSTFGTSAATSPRTGAAVSSAPPSAASASTSAITEGFYRQPALQGDRLVFVSEGDLWRASAQGGAAQRLTTHLGSETSPALSPDGRWLAFVGQYDGGIGDVYVMPATGGVPRRLSWDTGAVRVWGITPRNEVIYTGATERGEAGTQLYLVQIDTGVRRALPVGQAADGALSDDGRWLYFTRNGLRGDNARQYRGGAMARLWVMDLNSQTEARPLVAEGNNDRRPMPYRDAQGQDRIAFLSDRDGTYNLWSVAADGSDLRQHTHHQGWDIRHASLSGRQVVYAAGADLYRVDLDATHSATDSTTRSTIALPDTDPAPTGSTRLSFTLGSDHDQMRRRWVSKPQDFLTDVALSPDGERVVLTSRGRLATQGVGPLRRAELTVPQGLDQAGRCRDATFSADNRSVFSLCDFSGETEIWRLAANGTGQPEQITRDTRAMRQHLLPSPDGRWIAHDDKEGRLYLTDLQARDTAAATREIDRDSTGDGIQQMRWSADGKALAYVRNTSNVYRAQLMLYSIPEQRVVQLSSDRYAAAAPSFSPDGQWLYFLSRRSFVVTANGAPWGDRNMGPQFDRGWKVYALALQPGLRFPFAAPDELQSARADNKPEEKPSDNRPGAKDGANPSSASSGPAARSGTTTERKSKATPAIQLNGLAQRLYEVPLAAGNYDDLRVDAKRLYLLERKVLKQLPIGPQEQKAETVAEQVQSFDLSADGRKLMVQKVASAGAAAELLIVDAGPKLPPDLDKSRVLWSDWQIEIDPRAEWRQMFADGWRMQRDYVYDKDLHGVDWPAMRRKYAPLVDRVTERGELNEVMAQMVGEISLLHSAVRPGDVRQSSGEPGWAGLGALLTREATGWKINRIYSGDPELPSEAGPLAAPGLNIPLGSVITAINGRDATRLPDPTEGLRGQAGKQVLLQLRQPDGQTRSVVVTPVDLRREARLRSDDWRYGKARTVDQASGGHIGYVHLRAMGGEDIADFAREFYAQSDRDGLIIDVRHNNGGNIDSFILEKLSRRAWAFWQPRSPADSKPYPNMQQTFRGHVVVLANEETYSDGETFTEGFKRLGLGPVIGTTTSGAGVWLSDNNWLMDKGMMRAAETGQMLIDGSFIVEGKGVTPDIRVDNPPRATAAGQDAQLDAALAWLKKRIQEAPVVTPKPGPYPRPVKN
jgi:tricorn protease